MKVRDVSVTSVEGIEAVVPMTCYNINIIYRIK